MISHHLFRRSWLALSLTLIVSIPYAQDNKQVSNFQPESGQGGKDVIWVPTPQVLVDKMLDMAKVTSADYVMDLGSGDGRLVISAAKRGANAIGIEYNQEMVELSKQNAVKEKVGNKAKFIQADLFKADLSKATVITLFLLTDLNLRLRPQLLELRPGTRIVSNTFSMEEWEPDETVILKEDCNSWCKAYLWIIPAKAGGNWKLDQGDLILTQDFQMLSGKLKNGSKSYDISDGKLSGDMINFKANGEDYSGIVAGNTIQGIRIKNGISQKWSASRM